MPSGIAAVQGAVTDSGTSPQPGQVIESVGVDFVAVSGASGGYLLPVHPGAGLAVTVEDRANDRTATATDIDVSSPDNIANADLTLAGVAPRVVGVDPANHAGGVAPEAVIRVSFSEPLDPTTVSDTSIQLRQRPLAGQPTALAKRISFESGGRVLVITPEDPLPQDSIVDIEIAATVTDRQGEALAQALASDFTTEEVFRAAGLAPGALFVSLPERDDPMQMGAVEVAPMGEVGSVFVCGADPGGNCAAILPAALYEERCLTEVSPGVFEPGSFCVAFAGVAAGDRFVVGLEDAFGNRVEIDAGNMRDEETGAEVVGPDGGVVTFPGDERYQVFVPQGAFAQPSVVRVTPVKALPGVGELDLSDPLYAVLNSQAGLQIVGAIRLDFQGIADVQVDFSVPYDPAPVDADSAQYFVAQIIDFRGQNELTVVDTAFFDESDCPGGCLVVSDPSAFPGVLTAGVFGVVRPTDPTDCFAVGTGFVNIGGTFDTAYIPTAAPGVSLSFPVLVTDRRSFAVPVLTVSHKSRLDTVVEVC